MEVGESREQRIDSGQCSSALMEEGRRAWRNRGGVSKEGKVGAARWRRVVEDEGSASGVWSGARRVQRSPAVLQTAVRTAGGRGIPRRRSDGGTVKFPHRRKVEEGR